MTKCTASSRTVLLTCLRHLGLALCLASPALAQPNPLAWPTLTRDAKPWTRWWWLGSAVDSAGITRELESLARAGFGGVEITAIYGAHGAEPAFVPYLSKRWVALVGHTAREAKRLGMAVDLPPGSGWRMGGSRIADGDVNASLRVAIDSARGGTTWQRAVTPNARVEAAVAISTKGDTVEIARGVTAGPLRWTVPDGAWTVYVAETRPSGDAVKRPAPGGEGRAIDIFSRDATARYLAAFGDSLSALPKGTLRGYFHDSFEYTGDGSWEFFDAFRAARGYDLARELPALAGRADPDRVARVKSDYRRTIDEMFLERFVKPFTAWAHERGGTFRLQAHGSPGNLLDLYAAADIPETEIFGPLGGGDSDPLVSKLASSAAHSTGRSIASAEAFTWLGEHFTGTLDDAKTAADQLFVAGIDHFVYHGTAYSPATAAWPGWQFYASMEFNPRNAFWRDVPTLNAYVARVQSVLQSGRPDADVMLYWPVWDSWHDAAGMRMDFRVHDPKWLYGKPVGQIARTLWQRGVGFDYVSDRMLLANTPRAAVLVPAAVHMPPLLLDRLVEIARGGGTVMFFGDMPSDVPGLTDFVARRARLVATEKAIPLGDPDATGVRQAAVGRGRILVGGDVETLLAAADVRRESLVDHAGLRYVRVRRDGGRDYFVSNAGSAPLDGWMPLAVSAASVALLDPMTGGAGLATSRRATAGSEVRVQLAPGASIVVRTFDRPVTATRWAYREPAAASDTLRGRWAVSFIDGGPSLPNAFDVDSALPWTARGDSLANAFAGTARYTLHFDVPGPAARWLLDLGRVAETARVRLNGRALGTLIARPFVVETGALRAKDNVLEVEVTNVSANRIRDLDRRAVPWRIFYDINFVGIDYRPFDASKWPVRPAGLLGPVTLTPLR